MQQPDEDDDIPFYHESPSLVDLSPEDERFLMDLSDVVGKLKPRGLFFDSDDDADAESAPPPLVPKTKGPFKVYEDTSTPEKDFNIMRLKRMDLELFSGGGKKKILVEPVSVVRVPNTSARYTVRFHTQKYKENPKIIMVPYLLSFPCVDVQKQQPPLAESVYVEQEKLIFIGDADIPSSIVFKMGKLFSVSISKELLCRWKHHIVRYENISDQKIDFELTLSRKEDRLFIERVDITFNVSRN